MAPEKIQMIIEAALMISGEPLSVVALNKLFPEADEVTPADIKAALKALKDRYMETGIELSEVASGHRIQAKAELSPWLAKLWEERPPRYSRAFLETLAIIAYKQPITRAEIEEIRGVTVNTHIMKTLQEREWIRIIGHREVPGRPAIYGTTKEFLNYFNLKSLTELPSLAEFKSLEAQEAQLQVELALEGSQIGPSDSDLIPEERAVTVEQEESNVIPLHDDMEIDEENEDSEDDVTTG